MDDICVFKSVVNCELCKCGLESGKTLLMYAAECGNWKIAEIILSVYPDYTTVKNGRSAYDYAKECEDELEGDKVKELFY